MSGDVINIKTVITEVTQKLDTFGHRRTRRPLNGTGRNCSSVAIANNRLLDLDETHVSFRWKDYRESGGPTSKGHANQDRNTANNNCTTSRACDVNNLDPFSNPSAKTV